MLRRSAALGASVLFTMTTLSGCGGISRAHRDGSAGAGGSAGNLGASAGRGASGGDISSGGKAGIGGSSSAGGDAGTSGISIDPDGVCSPPCGVKLEKIPGVTEPFAPDSLFAALLYDEESQTFALRTSTWISRGDELLVIAFTWESNQYGYGEWVRGWMWVSFEPDLKIGGYSRPEGVEFTAVVEEPTIPLRIRAVFSYASRAILIHDAVREE